MCSDVIMQNGVFYSTGNDSSEFFNVSLRYNGVSNPTLYLSSTCTPNGTIKPNRDTYHAEFICISTLNNNFQSLSANTFKSGYYIGFHFDSYQYDSCNKSVVAEFSPGKRESKMSQQAIIITTIIYLTPILVQFVILLYKIFKFILLYRDRYRANNAASSAPAAVVMSDVNITVQPQHQR